MVETETDWLAGRVVENRHWTPTHFSLRVEAPRLDFEAGQFVKLALDVGGERVARPFSFVNAPGEPLSEFYGVVVPGGRLSPRLAALAAGDALYLSARPAGFLVLSELPDAATLWLLATGTGIAPFLSILGADRVWQRYARVVLVHAVRQAAELVYGERIESIARARSGRLRYLRVVSREAAPGCLPGRIPALLREGRLEAAADFALAAQDSQVMLCGNPDMVQDTLRVLGERGLRKHRRRTPGQITTENFW